MITNMKQQRNFQYRRALAELDMLNHRRRNLDRDLRRLELEGGMAPKEYLKALDDQRVKISAELTKIKTSHPKPAAPYADVKRQRLVDTLLGKTLATQQPLRDYSEPTVIGRIDNCEVYFHQIDHPTFQRYQDNQTSGDDTELDLSLEEYFYPDQNNLQCYVNIIDKTHWYCFDKAEYLCQHLLHIYEIPAPSCDSEVTWWANFDTAIHGAWGDAEWGWLRVTPFFYVSPNATIPSANTLMELAGNYLEYSASISWDNGPEKSTTGNSPKSYRGLYDVKAGQKSIVCFVITVDLFVREGQMGARAYGSTRTYQNAYCNTNGIAYLMWAKSIVPTCFISSAICSHLGRPDDCTELQVLRVFRDNYVARMTGGEALIADYYARAPKLVADIEASPHRAQILQHLYECYLRPCLADIENGRFQTALETYGVMLKYLEHQSDIGMSRSSLAFNRGAVGTR